MGQKKEIAKTVFPAEQIIYRKDDFGTEAFLILEGQVELSDEINGEKKVLAKLGPGEIFGQMAIFDQKRRFATAQALTEVSCHVMDERTLLVKMHQNPEFTQKLMRMVIANVKWYRALLTSGK